jgi:hypothetical protein
MVLGGIVVELEPWSPLLKNIFIFEIKGGAEPGAEPGAKGHISIYGLC